MDKGGAGAGPQWTLTRAPVPTAQSQADLGEGARVFPVGNTPEISAEPCPGSGRSSGNGQREGLPPAFVLSGSGAVLG